MICLLHNNDNGPPAIGGGLRRRAMAHGRRNRSRSGVAALEMAIVCSIVLLLLMGVADLSIAVYASNTVAEASRAGTRYAISHSSSSSSAVGPAANNSTVESVVRAAAPGLSSSKMTVTSTWLDGNNSPGSRVQVTVSYDYRPAAAWVLGSKVLTLRGNSTMVIPNWTYKS